MGLFDRFKKKVQPVESDTLCLLIMDRVMEDAAHAGAVLKQKFGSGAVGEMNQSDAPLTHMVVKLEGTEYWCSYMPFPVPPEEMKIPNTPQYGMFNAEEYQTLCDGKSFWIVAQKGGA